MDNKKHLIYFLIGILSVLLIIIFISATTDNNSSSIGKYQGTAV